MKIMAYLASPYSHNIGSESERQMVRNFRALTITRIAIQLKQKYNVVFFLPITQSHAMKEIDDSLGTNFDAWEADDLCAIDHCDEVWVAKLDGWKESIGVCAEIAHAKKTNKPVKYINPLTLRMTKK